MAQVRGPVEHVRAYDWLACLSSIFFGQGSRSAIDSENQTKGKVHIQTEHGDKI